MNVIRVGVAPWSHLKPQCFQKSAGCHAGVELDIFQAIASMTNSTIALVISKEGGGCGKTPFESGSNGTWTGLLKMLHNREIDVIGNFCNLNKFSQVDQDFYSASWPVWQYQEQFLLQTPAPLPLSFVPLAPFSWQVWLAYVVTCLVYLIFLILYSYLRYGSTQKLFMEIFEKITLLCDVVCGFKKEVPLQFVWPLWFLLLTSVFIFYNTFILSAVLHPFPVGRPFSTTNEFVDSLLRGEYRLISYKNPPTLPTGCSGQCEIRFFQAIKTYGFQYYPKGISGEVMSAIAEQNLESDRKLVLIDGMPFVGLYFADYPVGRDRFWIIDTKHEKWSGFLWRKNFTQAQQFNALLREIGDYRFYALSRYVRPIGLEPHREALIFEKPRQRVISLGRIRVLFFMLFGGSAIATLTFLAEIVSVRNFS